jgi:hypothetical protein
MSQHECHDPGILWIPISTTEAIDAEQTIHIFHTFTYIPLMLYPRRDSRGISDISPKRPHFTKILAMSNTADVTGGKHIAV